MSRLANIGLWLVKRFGDPIIKPRAIVILQGHVDAPPSDTFKARELGCTCSGAQFLTGGCSVSSDCPLHYLPLVEEVYIRLGSPLSPPSLSGADWTTEALRSSGGESK